MVTRTAQFVAFAAALVLVLPPGWCAGLCPHCSAQAGAKGEASSQPVTHACCQHARQAEAVASSLGAPSPECCCAVHSVATPGKVLPTLSLDSHLSASLAALPLALVGIDFASAHVESPVDPFHTGPPLRILQCVWRC